MNEQKQTEVNPWEGVEIISTYTRSQALEDGVLVDISDIAREAGFSFPVAVTQGVWAVLKPSKELEAEGQDWVGRTWDMLTILRHAIRNASRTDQVSFAPLFILKPGWSATPVKIRAICSPGDNAEPAITLMLSNED